MNTQREEARKSSPRIGALVTGIGGHGLACWITGVTSEEISLVAAHDAALTERETGGRTLLLNLSCSIERKWHLLSLRGTVTGVAGRAFRVRLLTPIAAGVQAHLLKRLSGGVAVQAGRPAAPAATALGSARPPVTSATVGVTKTPAQRCREIVGEHATQWAQELIGLIDEALIAQGRTEKHPAFRRRLDEDRATLALAQAAMQEEVAAQLTESVDDMFNPVRDAAARERTMDRTMGLMNTAGLEDMMSFVDVVQTVDRTTHPQVVALEARLTELLQRPINEDNNLLRAERLCEIVLGILIDRWPGGASNRQVVTDAIRDTAACLNKAYMALNDTLAPAPAIPATAHLRSAAH
jgi:hypothetical protein